MPLRVAVQMDPLERIKIAGDSTFAIMLKAQGLGHELFYYAPEDLSYAENRLWTMGYPVTVQSVAGDHYRLGEPVILDLGRDVDVVLMRQDPPFDLGYITATHLLERIRGETLVVNDPAAVRNAPEKVWVLDYSQFMPPTAVTRSLRPSSQIPRRARRNRHQAAARFCRWIGIPDRCRWAQSHRPHRTVQYDLSRAARPSEISSRDRARRQTDRAGRR